MLGVVKRLKLEHNYHDATVRSMELSEGRLTLAVPSSNHGIAEHRHLIFEGIRNEEELRQQLSTQPSNVRVEVIGVARVGPGRILVDLNTVSLELDCKLVVET
jgi:hypothetical protein